MDDLRWILLLLGAVVVAAIYFSGRFEGEDWARERKQPREGKRGPLAKKTRGKKPAPKRSPTVERTLIKKEPRMVVTETEAATDTTVEKSEQLDVSATSVIDPGLSAEPMPSTAYENESKPEIKTAQALPESDQREAAVIESPDIEDEITDVKIPVDLIVAETEIQIADSEPDEAPEQVDVPLVIEPLVLSVSVLAEEDESFGGVEIKEALEAEGLTHGAMRIYHFHAPANRAVASSDDAVFSVANLLEPGIFNLEKLDEMHTPGLMLFCQLPGPLPGEDAVELMLDKGRGLAVRLHGHMCDDKRNRFTTQVKNHYLDRIAVFERELVLARSKPSVS